MPKSDTIDEIAERAANDSADRRRVPERWLCLPHEVQEKPNQNRDRCRRQDRDEPRQHAKRGTPILGVLDCQSAIDNFNPRVGSVRAHPGDKEKFR